MFKLINKCRICGSNHLTTVMNLGNQALTGVFPRDKDEKVTSGPVELVKCTSENGCGLVQLKQSYDMSEMYGMNYGYRSGLNASMVKHLHSKVEKILALNILQRGDLVIDIGSNDATTLKAYPESKYQLVGIDPTGIKFSDYYPASIGLITDYFSSDVISDLLNEKKAKVITSFSMFYDLEAPILFALEIEKVLDDEGVWIFEQSYLPAMIKTNSFDTICHEHLEFYALKQIIWILDKANLKVIDVEFNDINGGSFSIMAAKKESTHVPNKNHLEKILEDEESMGLDDLEVFELFVKRADEACKKLVNFLLGAKEEGKSVVGLGASTKGNVLLQYCGISADMLSAIGDVNEDKFGAFTPGSLIPIVSEESLLAMNPDYLVIFPWHFRSFFESLHKMKGRKLVFPLPKFEIVQL